MLENLINPAIRLNEKTNAQLQYDPFAFTINFALFISTVIIAYINYKLLVKQTEIAEKQNEINKEQLEINRSSQIMDLKMFEKDLDPELFLKLHQDKGKEIDPKTGMYYGRSWYIEPKNVLDVLVEDLSYYFVNNNKQVVGPIVLVEFPERAGRYLISGTGPCNNKSIRKDLSTVLQRDAVLVFFCYKVADTGINRVKGGTIFNYEKSYENNKHILAHNYSIMGKLKKLFFEDPFISSTDPRILKIIREVEK